MFSFIFSCFSFSLTIVLNSFWLTLRPINYWGIRALILFNLLLASITILICLFFSFLVIFNSFVVIAVMKENTRLKIALVIPTGTPIKLVKEIILILSVVADKAIKTLSK